MKRSRLTRKHPLKQRARIRAKNHKRAAAKFQQAFGGKAEWVRSLPCAVPGCKYHGWAIEATHTKSRGAGGTSADLVPMCLPHHAEEHQIGIKTFALKYGINLKAIAEKLNALYREMEKAA